MRFPALTKRILCLWFPEWPVQRLVAIRPELSQKVLLLTESTGRGEFVRHCNGLARKRGVRPGMPVSEAKSFARSRDAVVVEPIHQEDDQHALRELALRCEPFSFCIGLEESDQPDCVLMDVTGIAHFFAGERALAKRLERELSEQRFAVRIAIGDTLGAAWAAAHYLARARQPVVIPTGQLQLLESLPVEGLRLSEAVVKKLHRLGIKTIRQLLALDRASLLPRLGTEVLVRLDQWSGKRAEFITPCRPAPRFHVERLLEEGITHPAAIEQLRSSLLKQLLSSMEAEEEVYADYRTTGLSLRSHPLAFQRDRLEQRGIVPTAALAHLPHNTPVKVAGLVLLRQHPGTAKGITFVTLEDETGTANLVVHQATWERFRSIAQHSQAWIAHGRVESKETVIHVVVCRLEDLTAHLSPLSVKSRDFR